MIISNYFVTHFTTSITRNVSSQQLQGPFRTVSIWYGGKAAEAWSWPLASIQSLLSKQVELELHLAIPLHLVFKNRGTPYKTGASFNSWSTLHLLTIHIQCTFPLRFSDHSSAPKTHLL